MSEPFVENVALTEAEAEALRTWLVERDFALGLVPTTAPAGLLDLWTLVRGLIAARVNRPEGTES